MLLPLLVIGRCFSHILADVIAIILFIDGTMLADVCCHSVADVVATLLLADVVAMFG